MKKIIAFIGCLISIILMSFNSFGGPKDDILELLEQKNLSGSASMSFYITLNSPLPEFIDPNGEISEVISKSKITYDMKYKTNEESTKLQAAMDVTIDIPEEYNPMLELSTIKCWVNMDYSDISNPIYTVIMQDPFTGHYAEMDYTEVMPAESFASILELSNLASQNQIKGFDKEFTSYNLDLQNKNAKLVIDEKTLKEVTYTTINNMLEIFVSGFSQDAIPSSEEELDQIRAEVDNIFNNLSDIQLFDENEAVIIEIGFNNAKQIESQKLQINVKTDLFELINAFSTEDLSLVSMLNPQALIDLSIVLDVKYSYINEDIKIIFPEITENILNQYEEYESLTNLYGSNLLSFKKPGFEELLDVSDIYAGYVYYTYKNKGAEKFIININDGNDIYTIDLLQAIAIQSDGFGGNFKITQNDKVIEEKLYANVRFSEIDDEIYFKFYTDQEQWYVDGYLNEAY